MLVQVCFNFFKFINIFLFSSQVSSRVVQEKFACKYYSNMKCVAYSCMRFRLDCMNGK